MARTGEKRKTRQPLKIDLLPQSVHDEILKARAAGKTWEEIEKASHDFVKWDELPTPVLEAFPELRIPKSNLHRWYDIRVDQVQKEILAEAKQAQVLAEKFAGMNLDGTNQAVMNAMHDHVFMICRSAGEDKREQLVGSLNELSLTLARLQRVALQKQKIELESQKLDVERQKLTLASTKITGLKDDVTKKQVSPEELQQRLDEIYGITAG